MVVDDGGDATVGVDLQVVWSLVFSLFEIEIHGLVRQPEFFENDGGFPKNWNGVRMAVALGKRDQIYQPLGPLPWVYKVNCFP